MQLNIIVMALGWAFAATSDGAPTLPSTLSSVVSPAPDRVKVVLEAQGFQLRTSQGAMLRGGSVASFRYQRDIGANLYLRSAAHWRRMRIEAGLNAVRLVAFDPWQASHGNAGATTPYPYADFQVPAELTATMQEMDAIVRQATANKMYVMINYHDVGNYRDPDYSKPTSVEGQFSYLPTMTNCRRFWRAAANRYKDNTNVFFELTNEPCAWFPENYTARDLANFKSLYDDVRAFAPNTHVVFCSFANTRTLNNRSMLDVARELKALGVDFTNASIGFHPYNSWYPDPNQRTEIDQLRKEFAVVNTEQNFPAGMIAGSTDPDGSGFNGDLLGVQSMERMRISWFHWNATTEAEFRDNFLGIVVPDAKLKRYFWVR